MKKLEIYRLDKTTQEVEIITLVEEYGYIREEAVHMLNTAENDMFVVVEFGNSSVVLPKGEIQYMVMTEVNDGLGR